MHSTKQALVIDDDKVSCIVMASLLKHYNFTTKIAENKREFIEQFNSNEFDIIFSDLFLSDTDGIDIAKHIRNTENNRKSAKTPIIITTGISKLEFKEKYPTEIKNIDFVLEKPIGKRDIHHVLYSLDLRTQQLLF